MHRLLVVIALMSTTAFADDSPPLEFGGGVQFFRPVNLGASFYLGFTKHQAAHIKAARYVPIQGIDSEEDYKGRIYDVGISWVIFKHRFLDGVGLEVGPFFRDYDLRRGGMHPIDDERVGVRALGGAYFPSTACSSPSLLASPRCPKR
jgi:hypothetical protein